MDLVMQFAAPAITGFCSGFGAVVALKVDVRWLKESSAQVKDQVKDLGERVARLEGRN